MKNICITKSNNKFNKNIIYYNNDNTKFIELDFLKISIYKHYYAHNQNIQQYIINTSCISNETLSFIQDFNNTIDFIIYHDIIINDLLNFLTPIAKKHLVNENNNYSSAITIPNFIVNDILYNNIEIKNKKDQIIYFLDYDNDIPIHLQSILYPNSKLHIKMFNNNKIQHPQNLGFIDELEKRNLLINSSIYAYSNNDYVSEAILCGCKVLNINESSDPKDAKIIDAPYTTYGQFLRDYIL